VDPDPDPDWIRIQWGPWIQSCEWNDKSMNREPESTTRIGPDASFFIRISKSTLTFEFRTISFSFPPLIFRQR
jgi:hypothetical protein